MLVKLQRKIKTNLITKISYYFFFNYQTISNAKFVKDLKLNKICLIILTQLVLYSVILKL